MVGMGLPLFFLRGGRHFVRVVGAPAGSRCSGGEGSGPGKTQASQAGIWTQSRRPSSRQLQPPVPERPAVIPGNRRGWGPRRLPSAGEPPGLPWDCRPRATLGGLRTEQKEI